MQHETASALAMDGPAGEPAVGRLRTALICQADDPLNREGLARWLASFSDLAGVVVLDETRQRAWRRVRREIGRVGLLRFLDVLAFRLYYKVALRARDRRWEEQSLADLCRRFPPLGDETALLRSASPNTSQVADFLRECRPDLVIARCKWILKPEIFTIPPDGTFVMHPGICPQYRNAHGCFWALANDDLDNVGMTLLRIDRGVDTGPVYGFFRCRYDERSDSHHVIQHRTVFDNLDAIRDRLLDIHGGRAGRIDTQGRPSGEWGQPWLTAYRRWQKAAAGRSAHAD
jgi:hypothetical protein